MMFYTNCFHDDSGLKVVKTQTLNIKTVKIIFDYFWRNVVLLSRVEDLHSVLGLGSFGTRNFISWIRLWLC